MPISDKSADEGSEWIPKDWFISAITCDGNVNDSLIAVIDELDRKKKFITAVHLKLCGESFEQADHLTALGKQVKDLENTLRFRLGILRPEREIAWFRKPIHKDFGPFRSSMIMEPVFSHYAPEHQQALKDAIKLAWQNGATGPLPFQEQTENLWRMVLQQNARLNYLASLEPVFKNLRLDKLPDGLPADLDSRSLRAFLINVRGEFVSIRERLKICYDQLWDASEKFWQYQSEKLLIDTKKSPRPQSSSQSGRPRPDGAGRGKHEETVFLSFSEVEALRFMGFKDPPPAEVLRRRYLEMAKKLHPDHGGNPEAFKMLHKAYKALVK
jgi:hypothetical protein